MSKILQHVNAMGRKGKLRDYRATLEKLDFHDGDQPVTVDLANGRQGLGTCLGCADSPCMVLDAIHAPLSGALSEFPSDPGNEVCPTESLSWNLTRDCIDVDTSTCIGCGLCVARCPYGAISLTSPGTAIVQGRDPDGLTIPVAAKAEQTQHPKPVRVGKLGPSKSHKVSDIPASVDTLDDAHGTRFVRNLLIECGVECRTRRRGDPNVRMDGVLRFSDGHLGVLEIELRRDVLESPRALIEDVAVLHRRYSLEVTQIHPVSVILQLPNARSEYFSVISDIEAVLHIRCRTLTVGALLAVLWRFQLITGFPEGLFMTSPGKLDLLPAMREHLSTTVSMTQPYPGAYRPTK